MNHWDLFKQSWRIFWRNPALWLFGLLAALGGGFSPRYNFNFNFNPNVPRLTEVPLEFRALLDQIFRSQAFGTFVVIGIVWMIFAFLLTTFADGALMGMVNTIGGGEKAGIGAGFRAASKRFLPLLAVRFVLALPALILGLIAAVAVSQIVFNSQDNAGPFGLFTRTFSAAAGLGTLSFIVGLLMAAIGVSAERAVVLDELPIWPSIVKGWKMLWGKFGDYFTIVLLFIVLGIAVGLLLACILLPLLCGSIGLSAFTAATARNSNPLAAVVLIAGPALIIAVLLGLLFGTLVNVFTSSVWTLAYRDWGRPAPSPAGGTPQPVAASGEAIPPIESVAPPPSNNPPPPGNGA